MSQCVIYLNRILTSNTISPPASTPFISHCCRLFIILQIQLSSFFLPPAYYAALLCCCLFSFLSNSRLPQTHLQASYDKPPYGLAHTWPCFDLFNLIKMHPSRTLGALLTARLAEPLISAVFSHCFLSSPGTTFFFSYNNNLKFLLQNHLLNPCQDSSTKPLLLPSLVEQEFNLFQSLKK